MVVGPCLNGKRMGFQVGGHGVHNQKFQGELRFSLDASASKGRCLWICAPPVVRLAMWDNYGTSISFQHKDGTHLDVCT